MLRVFGWTDVLFLFQGMGWTLVLSAVTFLCGGLLALPVSLARISRWPALRLLAIIYLQLIQGIPVLMLLFMFYFGLNVMGYRPPAFISAMIGLVLYTSAFLADIWRGAIQAIPKTQWEAAEALALTPFQRMAYVIIPQAIRQATPPTVGFLVQVVKNTSIASIIGYVELSRAGQMINDATFQPLPVFMCVAAMYFAIGFPLSALSRQLERRLHVARANS